MPSVLSLNLQGKLVEFHRPLVMSILNATPDSFHAASRARTETAVREQVRQMLADGADIIDVGACSTRPGGELCDATEEMRRLRCALRALREEAPHAVLSVDTFRSDVARMAVEEYGAAIINDVTGGRSDRDMFRTIAQMRTPYVLTHNADHPTTPQDVLLDLVRRADLLHTMGVTDVILDPGIGFKTSREEDFALLHHLQDFKEAGLPLLVGLSRKRLVWETLGITPDDERSLHGTSVLNMFALTEGADILRVHDVRAAADTVRLFLKTTTYSHKHDKAL